MWRVAARRVASSPLVAPSPRRSASSLAAQLVSYSQERVSRGEHGEAVSVLEHGLTLVGSGEADDSACVGAALAAVHRDTGRFATAAALYDTAGDVARTPALAVSALVWASASHSAAASHPAALHAAQRAETRALGDPVLGLAVAGARASALHASGSPDTASAFAPLSAAAAGAAQSLSSALAAGVHAAALWRGCCGDASGAQGLLALASQLSLSLQNQLGERPGSAHALLCAADARLLSADVALASAQVALFADDADGDAEAHAGEALRLAEALSGDQHPRVGLVLAVSADARLSRLLWDASRQGDGTLGDATEVFVCEALYRRALKLLGEHRQVPGADALAPPLKSLLLRRLAEVLRIAGPTRGAEAARVAAEAAWHDDTAAVVRPWAKAPPAQKRAMLSLRLHRPLLG